MNLYFKQKTRHRCTVNTLERSLPKCVAQICFSLSSALPSQLVHRSLALPWKIITCIKILCVPIFYEFFFCLFPLSLASLYTIYKYCYSFFMSIVLFYILVHVYMPQDREFGIYYLWRCQITNARNRQKVFERIISFHSNMI